MISLFGQGLTLIILLFIVGIPNLIAALSGMNSAFSMANSTSYILAVILSFTIYPFINGYIAKAVAGWWEKGPDKEDDDISPPSVPLPP